MSEAESLLLLDAPVELASLLRAEEQAVLLSAGEDLGCALSIVDRDGHTVLGTPPPAAVLAAEPEAEAVWIETPTGAYLCAALFHDGDRLALLAAGPVRDGMERPARFLLRTADLLLSGALRRTLAARLHVATVEDSYLEIQRKNERLEQALQRMQELDRMKANFLATVSHELRTPLTSVMGYSEMLMEGLAGPLNDEQREYLRTVMDKGEQLLGLITGILDISRLELVGVELQREPVDVAGLVHDVLATVAPQARRKQVRIQGDLPPHLPLLDGDRSKLRQALLNLVGNAIKFTPPGGEVGIGAAVRESELRMWVADTGIGIPEHLHERVFDPFYQVDSSSTREYGGTGLGLSIARRFVEAHGGRVWIESRPKGVIFYLALPLGGGHCNGEDPGPS
ncbi:MAG: HAMP domain-containing histidine kinase [Myxococcota bacterium]|nr:HAMP domain-containing histidine kinase [Myxococcota bacterium]